MCKSCILRECFNKKEHDIDLEGFKRILRQIDKPYIESILQGAIKQYNDTYDGKRVPIDNRKIIITYYFKNINTLRQFRTLDWEQGIEWEKRTSKITNRNTGIIEEKYVHKDNSSEDKIYTLDEENDFVVTKEIIKLFGAGYTKKIYKAMWDKYNFLKESYPDITNFHIEALATYVRFKVKEEIATMQGNAIDAEKWSKSATNAAEKAKINPSQLSKSDLQGGLNSFSELSMMVEQAVDVIPILPRFKFRPNDAIDFNIWCLINYLRDLEGKERCSYEDVYHFYDERKKEYIAQYGDQYGIFTDDTTESNRDAIKKFISLPNDYNSDSNSDNNTGDE